MFAYLLYVGATRGDEFAQDFRIAPPDGSSVRIAGPEAARYVSVGAEGVRVSLPADRNEDGPVGLESWIGLHGGVGTTGGYELLGGDPPQKTYGAGFNLFVRTRTVPYHEAILGRFQRGGRELFIVTRLTSNAPPRFHPTRADTNKGRLRLARTGGEI